MSDTRFSSLHALLTIPVEGQNEYTTCNGLLNQSSSSNPNTALFQIAASGVPLNKLLIGKPAKDKIDADNGYIDPNTLATCVAQAKSQGWSKCLCG